MFRRLATTALLLLLAASYLFAQGTDTNPPRQGGSRGPLQGVGGTIRAIEGQTFTLKTFRGTVATINTSENTRFFRQERQPAKFTDFKLGEAIFIAGDEKDGVWSARLVRLQPDMAALRQELGKRFIVGQVGKIDGTKLTILRPDGESQVIEVDENTSFRNERRESITLADIKVGDHVFGRGELKNGVFVPQVLNTGELVRMRSGPPGQAPRNNQ
jgi:hypothetical protein